MATLHQTVQIIKPVPLPDLNQALERTFGREVVFSESGEDAVDTCDEGELDTNAHQFLAQLQSGRPEAALGFVRDDLVAVARKGGGKGAAVRFAPH